MRTLMACFVALVVTTSAHAVVITSTAPQSGFSGFSSSPFPLATFNYTPAQVSSLATIDQIAITLQIRDGDTASGNFDFNDLTLYLDGINTGIRLNGFPNNNTVTLTVGPLNNINGAALLAALQDGVFIATAVDADPNDNDFGVPSTFRATLSLTGQATPEPVSLVVFGGLVVGGAGIALRRRMAVKAAA